MDIAHFANLHTEYQVLNILSIEIYFALESNPRKIVFLPLSYINKW